MMMNYGAEKWSLTVGLLKNLRTQRATKWKLLGISLRDRFRNEDRRTKITDAENRVAASVVPKLKLKDGREMPATALGTYLGFSQNGLIQSMNHQLRDVVSQAIDLGYRHFDTASVYNTEGELGEAITEKIREGKVKRDEIFITTKLWNTQHGRNQVTGALRQSLKTSGLDYVDLYLIHWPMGLNKDYTYSDVDFTETWKGMEDVHRAGLAKSIGVSNFSQQQLSRLLEESSVKPSVLQIEVHPQLTQSSLVSYAQAQGVAVMGYSPFGALVSRFTAPAGRREPVLHEIAEKYAKSEAQVVLRWLVERQIVPIPKTVNSKRLEENISIFDFQLNKEEIAQIATLNTDTRINPPSFWQDHPHYPFEKTDNPVANPFVKISNA